MRGGCIYEYVHTWMWICIHAYTNMRKGEEHPMENLWNWALTHLAETLAYFDIFHWLCPPSSHQSKTDFSFLGEKLSQMAESKRSEEKYWLTVWVIGWMHRWMGRRLMGPPPLLAANTKITSPEMQKEVLSLWKNLCVHLQWQGRESRQAWRAWSLHFLLVSCPSSTLHTADIGNSLKKSPIAKTNETMPWGSTFYLENHYKPHSFELAKSSLMKGVWVTEAG